MKYLPLRGSKKKKSRVSDGPVDARDDLIDLRYIFRIWVRWSWIPLVLAVGGAFMGYRDLQGFQPKYVASMTVLPATGAASQAARGLGNSSIFGNLGFDLRPSASSPTFDRLRLMLGSVTLAQRLQEKHSLMQEVYSGSWDAETQTWIRPSGDDFEKDQRRRAALKLSNWKEPNAESLAGYVGGNVDVEEVPGTVFMKVTFQHRDAKFAFKLLGLVYEEADELLREQDRLESRQRRSYIEGQLRNTNSIDMKQALIGLLTGEERTAMLLESDLPYAARVIEPTFVSSRATEPAIAFVFGVPVFAGVLIGFALVTFVAVMRRE